MCGIAGFYDSTGFCSRAGSTKQSDHCFTTALKTLARRGPDTEGVWEDMYIWLGHRRLSIVDTASRGKQPMEYDNLVISFNGMIYNYKEIRQKLIQRGYKFHTETDTEVILAGFAEWQQDLLPHLFLLHH